MGRSGGADGSGGIVLTMQETGIIMDILSTAYPRFYAGREAPDPRKAMALWAEMFSGDPVELVAAAVKALIATDVKGFPPHIGAVKDKIRQISQNPQMLPSEAWAVVWRAVQRSGYNSREEFKKLPETLKRLVGSAEQLKAWSQMDADTVQSVIASNFQRSYQARAKQEADFMALPEDVKKIALSVSGNLAIEAGTEV